VQRADPGAAGMVAFVGVHLDVNGRHCFGLPVSTVETYVAPRAGTSQTEAAGDKSTIDKLT